MLITICERHFPFSPSFVVFNQHHQLSENLALVGDVRVFRFKTLTLQWTRVSAPTTELEELLLEELEQELAPIEFEPTWFQVMGGIVIRF